MSVLSSACASVGLDATGARLLRRAENSSYALAGSPVVVRIGRVVGRAELEVRVARWLAGEGFPAARLAPGAPEEPLVVDGCAVTFWELVPEMPGSPSYADLAVLLRRLHRLEPPDWLPPFDPLDAVDRRLTEAPASADVLLLRSLASDLRARLAGVEWVLAPGPVHGDAHPGNVLNTAAGPVLIDFEEAGAGPPEWDLILPAAYRHSFGWLDEPTYASFTTAYGYDVAGWPWFEVLRGIRELRMVTWLMLAAPGDPGLEAEYQRRVDDLRADRFPRRWARV